jgi:hypothetical protein
MVSKMVDSDILRKVQLKEKEIPLTKPDSAENRDWQEILATK